jgi:hypothetical protein
MAFFEEKKYTYESYAYEAYTNIGTLADRSSGLGISATAPAQEVIIIDQTTGGAAGPITLKINSGEQISLVTANLPFTLDKFLITKLELGGDAADDLAVLASF